VTAVDTRCKHEMLPGQCSLCQKLPDDRLLVAAALGTSGRDQGRGMRLPAVGPQREAIYRTRCPGDCGTWIQIGDPIVHLEDEGLWVCQACAGAT
jgi:hypothetical protein